MSSDPTAGMPPGIYFLAVQASSPMRGGFPVEVAWVDADGHGESHLVRPAETWMNPPEGQFEWSAASELLHGISLIHLMEHGAAADHVATRVSQTLAQPGVRVFSDDPEMVGQHLARLLSESGIEDHVVQDIAELYRDACLPVLRLAASAEEPERHVAEERLSNLARDIVETAEEAERIRSHVLHRALPEAESLWRTWRAIRDAVAKHVAAANSDTSSTDDEPGSAPAISEGARIGRFVILRDLDGQTHAVSVGSIAAIHDTDEGALLMLPGGKLLHVGRPMVQVLAWLDGRHV